ncbi:metallophosphoesterase [Mesorhizobium sp. WSM3224]|uniref:metallophosphoesterase n=1 Tax=Mesorhizobium sp. WSM3224 TaxID=1040986 RepID=UPI0012EBBB44|nr:metallophosphoesterase [Mesorhizobium sp. WSM3224]
MVALRIVTTHDFFGCFAPLKTTTGSRGGGYQLRATVDSMRKQVPTVWIDTGDLVQGGPLSLPTFGRGGVAAASELGVDVSVIGNHELDFGVPFFRESLHTLNFPVLGANAGIGLPPTTIIQTSGGDVGVIGLTHHDLASMRSWSITPDRHMPCQGEIENAVDVVALARGLRSQGARIVVAAVHDGIDWKFDQDRQFAVELDRLVQRCQPWAKAVDVILAGHTLGRFRGEIDGTPIVQPWPMGCEVGVVDIDHDNSIHTYFREIGEATAPSQRWDGHGAEIIDIAENSYLGLLPTALSSQANVGSSLSLFLAQAVSSVSDSDLSAAYSTYSQPVSDGAFAFLGKGRVTSLDILQLVPYSDHSIVSTDIGLDECQRVNALLGPRPQTRSTIWSFCRKRIRDGDLVSLSTVGGAATDVLSTIVGRELYWRRAGANLCDGVSSILRRCESSVRESGLRWAGRH